MTLIELSSPSAVSDFVRDNACCLVTFSAHWCGPCKASKPQLEGLARQYAVASPAPGFPIAIAYESDLEDALVERWRVRAFPTYVVFENGSEVERIEGADLQSVERMIQKHQHKAKAGAASGTTGGASLGGQAAASPADARAARLARLGGGTAATATPAAAAAAAAPESKPEPEAAKKESGGDVEMKDAEGGDAAAAAAAAAKDEAKEDPASKLDPAMVETLTASMGFTPLRAQKGLLYGGPTVEAAVEWLLQHQDDAGIDEPIPEGGGVAQSYKCNECGKVLSNMANLELHANKTGHADFEESTESVVPLTAEEKAAKIVEIKRLLKEKRSEREDAEKEDQKAREMQRRFTGKEMAKTREQMEIESRKREAMLRRKEKEEEKKERARLRAQLAQDKAERQAHKGKLTSKLGVDGYNPSIMQHDVKMEDAGDGAEGASPNAVPKKKKMKADASRIDEYISRISSYRAGGDGGKCLKVLKAYVGNVVDHPGEDKYKTINTENKAFKTKVKPFVGAKNILLAVGFHPNDGADALVLADDADSQVLASTKQKLEAALVAYG